jgi:hypothetical protein
MKWINSHQRAMWWILEFRSARAFACTPPWRWSNSARGLFCLAAAAALTIFSLQIEKGLLTSTVLLIGGGSGEKKPWGQGWHAKKNTDAQSGVNMKPKHLVISYSTSNLHHFLHVLRNLLHIVATHLVENSENYFF